MDITLTTAIAGLVFGILGATLGIINTWKAFDRDRMRVKVTPVLLIFGDGDDGFGVEVTNLSYFAVTIKNVGFTIKGRTDRLTWSSQAIDGVTLPERMEPRTSFTAILPITTGQHEAWSTIGKAYVLTACGRYITGTSGALKQKIKKGKAARK